MKGFKNFESLDIESDYWEIAHPTNVGYKLAFNFSFFPNEWIKNTHKQIVIESITLGRITMETINRYHYSLRYFISFLKEYEIDITTYENLKNKHIQEFVFYLQQQKIGKSTMSLTLSALKWIIRHGQMFEYEGFPKNQLFDGGENKSIRQEDTLKTKYITDYVMNQIIRGLRNEDDLLFRSLMEIGIDTGVRIGEVLELREGCITEDFTGKPILHIYDRKKKTERYMAVSERVRSAVKTLENITEEGRTALNTPILAVYWQKINKKYAELKQKAFRDRINRFIKRHNIRCEKGELYNLNYHAFRHRVGTDMLNTFSNYSTIAHYFGHKSLHSTALYAKLQNPTVQKEYKKLGFIGTIVEDVNEKELGKTNIDEAKLKVAALPDGACSKPIDNTGNICANYNICIICPKFITTPKHLSIHKEHLARLQADKEGYMASEYIGTTDHLNRIEGTLISIIKKLEEMDND